MIDMTPELHTFLTDFRSAMEVRLDKVEGRLDKMEGRLDKMEGRLDKMDGRLDKMDGRLGSLEARVEGTLPSLVELIQQLAAETRVLERTVVSLSSAMTHGFESVSRDIIELRQRLNDILTLSMEGRTAHAEAIGTLRERMLRLEQVVEELRKGS